MTEAIGPAAAVGAVALAIYLRTMCRTIYVGDSGELAAAVHTLGIPHPPGYPLYVLMGKLFSLLVPIGTPALRLNIFSAVCSSLGVVFLYLILIALEFSMWTSAGVALTWALSASLWSQSGIPRVYALGALISAAATWCAVRWYLHPEAIGWLIGAAGIVALGVGNHTVAAIHVPAIALLVLLRRPEALRDVRIWIGFAACAVAPMLLYFVWLPLRARMQPPVNWGNIRSIRDLWNFLARKQYWHHRYVRSVRQFSEVVGFYFQRIVVEFGWLGTSAIVVGIYPFATTHRALAAMAAALVLFNMLSMILHARREDIFHWTRYTITAWFALAMPLAFGLQWMLSVFPESTRPFAAFVPAILLLVSQWRRQDLSRHRYADEYNRRILQTLPPNATLIAQDDNVVFPLMYLKYAENVRPDVKLLEQGVHQLQQLKFNPRKEAIYCTHWQAAFNSAPSPRGPGLRLVAEGLIYRIVSTDMSYAPPDLWKEHLLADMEDGCIPRNYLTRCLLGHVYFMRAEWVMQRDPRQAMAWYARAARMAFDSAVQHFNLGLSYERMGCMLAAADEFSLAAKIDPTYQRTTPMPTANAAPAPATVVQSPR